MSKNNFTWYIVNRFAGNFVIQIKIVDKFIDSLSSQSYRLSFLILILYSLSQPIVNYDLAVLFNQNDELEYFDYFQVLFFMLIVQLMFFWKLKGMNK
tara:strand:+ start:53 stop:343 length:291 start_codon:yes stop_codon:yes gene_type:complete